MRTALLRTLALCTAALILTGGSCEPPTSLHPLSDPAKAAADPRLVGAWFARLGDGDAWLHVIGKTGALLDFVLVGDDGDKGAAVIAFEGFPSEIKGRRYLNLRTRSSGPYDADVKLGELWTFARYDVAKDGGLTIELMNDDLVAAAVKAGALAGVPTTDGATKLSSDGAALGAWIAAQDPAKLFTKLGTFKRVARPAVPPAAPGAPAR